MIARVFFAALLAATLTGSAAAQPLEAAPAQPVTTTAGVPVYKLAPDDKLKITVFGEAELTGEYLVGSDGNLSFPLIGMVPVSGLTLAELQALLTTRLGASYLKEPKVSADVIGYRPFYILGEVSRAGQYPYRVGMTINAAVATAGGFTYRANRKRVVIQHFGDKNEQKVQLTSDLMISPGDTIRILERFF